MQVEVIYQNRIFNIKKKYTLPTERSENNTFLPNDSPIINNKSNNPEQPLPKFKHSEYFGKYLDSINKHQPILRRGACDAAVNNFFQNTLTHRQSRIKTEVSNPSSKIVSFRSVNNSQTGRKNKAQKLQQWRQIELKSSYKNLPSLSLRGTSKIDEMTPLPIKVQQFISKGVRRQKEEKNESELKRVKKVMLRRLQVQLINYNLLGKLGKWVNSSIKS